MSIYFISLQRLSIVGVVFFCFHLPLWWWSKVEKACGQLGYDVCFSHYEIVVISIIVVFPASVVVRYLVLLWLLWRFSLW